MPGLHTESSATPRPPGSRLRSAWFWTTSANGVLGLVVFVVAPWAANVLGPDRRGRMAAVQLVPQMLADLAALGLGFSIVHFGSSRRSSLRGLLRWSFRPLLVGSTVMFAIGQLLVAPILEQSPADVPLMRTYLLICPFSALFAVSSEVIRALGRFKEWNGFVLTRGLLWPVSLVIGLSGMIGVTIAGVMLTNLALVAVLSVVVFWTAWHRTVEHDDPPAVTNSQYVRYGMASAVSTIPRTANANLDQVIMSFRVDRSDLGLYAAAVGWSAMTMPVMRGITGISMPHVSGATTAELPSRVRQIVTISAASVVVLTGLGLLATLLLWNLRYDSAYHQAFLAALILIPAGLFLELNAILGNVLRSLSKPGLVAVLEVAVLTCSTAALFVALTYNAVIGPAIVSFGTYLLACVLYCWFIARVLRVSISSLVQPNLILSQIRSFRPRGGQA